MRAPSASALLVACQRAPRRAAGGGATAVHEVPPESARVAPAPLDSTAALQQARDSAIAAYVAAREQFGTTQGRIRAALGTPDSVQATPFQNAHDSKIGRASCRERE